MVEDFPTSDRLHLLDIGSTKQLILGWIYGVLGNEDAKLSPYEKQQLSLYMKSIKKPFEINRPIRGIDELKHWKGTEYRTFLLYISVVALKGVFEHQYIYNHFLLYFCGVTICSSDYHLKKLSGVAEEAIKHFLEQFKIVYGEHCIFSNIHNLSHLMDDVRRFGCLDKFSTYGFENLLFIMKNLVRNGNLPLSQIAKRLIEIENSINFEEASKEKQILKKQVKTDTVNLNLYFRGKNYELYNEIELSDYRIDTSNENKWFLSRENELYEFKHAILLEQQQKFLYATKIKDKYDFFDKPFVSSALFVYASDCLLNDTANLLNVKDIKCKMFKVNVPDIPLRHGNSTPDYDHSCVFFPLIHTLK